jgi:hypothetical protein
MLRPSSAIIANSVRQRRAHSARPSPASPSGYLAFVCGPCHPFSRQVDTPLRRSWTTGRSVLRTPPTRDTSFSGRRNCRVLGGTPLRAPFRFSACRTRAERIGVGPLPGERVMAKQDHKLAKTQVAARRVRTHGPTKINNSGAARCATSGLGAIAVPGHPRQKPPRQDHRPEPHRPGGDHHRHHRIKSNPRSRGDRIEHHCRGRDLLMLEALRRRHQLSRKSKVTVPVPVWITCGSWNPETMTFAEHVVEVLTRDYPGLTSTDLGGRAAPLALIDHGHLAVFLDGLDECLRPCGQLRWMPSCCRQDGCP